MHMNGHKKQAWITCGYAHVAENGFDQLSVNTICRLMNKSKSSFYHYFGEVDFFRDQLMDHQVKRAHAFAEEIANCPDIFPSLIDVFMAYKIDIFFYKQFRLFRDQQLYERQGQQVFDLYENAVLDKWEAYFGLQNRRLFVRKFNKFLSEHFLLSISFKDYTYDWVKQYLVEIAELVRQMKMI